MKNNNSPTSPKRKRDRQHPTTPPFQPSQGLNFSPLTENRPIKLSKRGELPPAAPIPKPQKLSYTAVCGYYKDEEFTDSVHLKPFASLQSPPDFYSTDDAPLIPCHFITLNRSYDFGSTTYPLTNEDNSFSAWILRLLTHKKGKQRKLLKYLGHNNRITQEKSHELTGRSVWENEHTVSINPENNVKTPSKIKDAFLSLLKKINAINPSALNRWKAPNGKIKAKAVEVCIYMKKSKTIANLSFKFVPYNAKSVVYGKRGNRYFDEMFILNLHLRMDVLQINKADSNQSDHTRVYNAIYTHLNDPFMHLGDEGKSAALTRLANAFERKTSPDFVSFFHGKRFYSITRNNRKTVIYDHRPREANKKEKMETDIVEMTSRNNSAFFQVTKNPKGRSGLSFSDIRLSS